MMCDDFRAAFIAGDAGRDHPHLDGCAACRDAIGYLDVTRSLLGDTALWEEPGPGLGDTITTLISGAAEAAATVDPSAAGDTREPPTSARQTWIWGVAAVLVGLVAVVGVTLAMRGPAADWVVVMPGTSDAPGATATVAGWNTPNGTRLVLTIDGLEPAPAGSFYEMWLSNDDVHVSAGTFTDGGTVELLSGVPRSGYPRLWVTLEPVDADESPSHTTVLDTG